MRRYLDLGVGVGDLSRPVRPLAWARNDRHHLQVIAQSKEIDGN
jgi:hypothetical protein